jgi:hypothetical protein
MVVPSLVVPQAFRPCEHTQSAAEGTGGELFAATDKVFWGSRAAMQVAARLYSAIGPVFERPSSDPLRRPINARLLLAAALSIPHAAWSTCRSERQHYNKVAMLPFPVVANVHAPPVEPREATLAHLRAALANGYDVVHPADRTAAREANTVQAAAATSEARPTVHIAPGLRAGARSARRVPSRNRPQGAQPTLGVPVTRWPLFFPHTTRPRTDSLSQKAAQVRNAQRIALLRSLTRRRAD